VYLVTGATSGIGKATALGLARRGATVVLACRSEERARAVVEEIEIATGSPLGLSISLDLASLASVRAAAEAFSHLGLPLHVLVNNAGVGGQRGQTADGFELAFGTNHLGHFLLTSLLLGHLRACAPSRVVTVSSASHYNAKGIDFDAVHRPTRSISGLPEYSVSKLCNVLFAQELARREGPRGVSSFSLHPGVVATGIWRRVPWPARPLVKTWMSSPEQGAKTVLYCACEAGLERYNGSYFDSCAPRAPSRAATPELAEALWARSEDFVAGER
jgi:NAD(P)-dependent dehydrogenase (short-subunit alcohol dehydrogenase family)